MSRLVRSLLVVVAAAAVAQGTAAQDLSGLWFRMKVRFSGYSIDPDALTTQKAKFTVEAYVHLTVAVVDGVSLPATPYNFELWCETSPGTWGVTSGGGLSVESVDETNFFLRGVSFPWSNADGQVVEGYGTDLIRVKRDKEGAITGATWKSLGGSAMDGTSTGDDGIAGNQVRSGKAVSVDQLPFDPEA